MNSFAVRPMAPCPCGTPMPPRDLRSDSEQLLRVSRRASPGGSGLGLAHFGAGARAYRVDAGVDDLQDAAAGGLYPLHVVPERGLVQRRAAGLQFVDPQLRVANDLAYAGPQVVPLAARQRRAIGANRLAQLLRDAGHVTIHRRIVAHGRINPDSSAGWRGSPPVPPSRPSCASIFASSRGSSMGLMS